MDMIDFNDLPDLDTRVASYGALSGDGEDGPIDVVIAIITIAGD